MKVATAPTASEFHGGIIGVTLRSVSGADFVSPITDEHLLQWQSPISPQMFLQTGLGRASTRQLCQPPVGRDWVLPRYSRRPHRPTPISWNFSE